ncbi:ribonuclease H-like domain-containing protein [Tanacetum coccineum]
MVPRAVLMKPGLVSLNTAKQVNTAHLKITMNSAKPMTTLSKLAHSTGKSHKWIYKDLKSDLIVVAQGTDREHVHLKAIKEIEGRDMFAFGERCDNGTEFKNKEMNQFCKKKGIKREFSVARTPQQNGVTKPHNTTPYELFLIRKPALGFMKPFGCLVIILNSINHLGKFNGKADEGFFIGYSINSKAFRVFNSRTRIVKENLHVQFSENTPNIAGSGPNWLFDIDALTKSMNYKPVVAGNQSNGNAGTKACDDAGKARMEIVPGKDYILLPLWTTKYPTTTSFVRCVF